MKSFLRKKRTREERQKGNREMAGIKVLQGDQERILDADPNENLLKLLQDNGYFIPAACGGNGTCGKCRVDYRLHGKAHSALACRTEAEDEMEVTLPEWSEKDIITEGVPGRGAETASGTELFSSRADIWKGPVSAAVDLGTTTIAAALISGAEENNDKAEVIDRKGAWNRQAAYGADVISRIQYIMEHQENGLQTLSRTVRGQTIEMLRAMCERNHIDISQIGDVYIAGNTIMEHIFCGISPVSIAAAPFTPETLFLTDESPNCDSILMAVDEKKSHQANIHMAPCVSGYVGGDIVSGLAASGMAEREETGLFLDIGTNGEMAIGGKDGLICCAVASGPAFEGAQIACGMSASTGAVSAVSWEDGKLRTEVVGEGSPRGICGSGLVDLLAVLLECNVIDESGCFLSPEEAEEEGVSPEMLAYLSEDKDGNGMFWISRENEVYFSAQDVRRLQLAKAAVAAGIEVLLKEKEISAEQVDRLYIAGGFGKHLNLRSAAAIGMFPAVLEERAVYAGNASLLGAERACMEPGVYDKMQEVQAACRYLELSGNEMFNEAYIEQMMFGGEDREEEE
jgi:uncharacterized 2Fe-2S/4Fe-4S cluster protein (DUF4445 family)